MAEVTKKVGLVARVVAILGLDDAGKMQKFFDKEKKDANREIKKVDTNKNIDKMNHENELGDLQLKLEDAQDRHNDAKTAITPENVVNNEAMARFSESYWANIKRKKDEVTEIKEAIIELKEDFDVDNKENDKIIKSYKERISIIDEKK
jgi:hypothetical protein